MDENKNKRLRPRRSPENEPVVRPEPAAQPPKEPAQPPKQPAQQPKTPAQQPKTPAQQPKTPAQPPKQPVQQPKTPVQQPKTPVQQPKTPVQQPKQPAQQPKQPAQQPKPPVQQSKQPVQQPKPEAPAKKPVQKPSRAEEDENQKTRLTDAQPKAELREFQEEEPEEEETGGSTLGGILKAVLYMTVVLIVSAVLAYGIIVAANDVFAFVKSDEAVEVVIPENATMDDVAQILGDAGVIRYPGLFRLYAKFKGETGFDKDGNSILIPGTYSISPMKNYMQLCDAFKEQYTRETVWVTFPEGSTVEDIITILTEEYGISTREKLISAINDYDYELEFLEGLSTENGRYYRLEGYLFPDTYQFYTDSSAETVIYKMLVNFEKKLSYICEDYGKERLEELGLTLDEVVTLASIIEKEVKYPVDYDQVSSVFHNRLADPANFPRLDSDATSMYAVMMATGTRPETADASVIGFDSPYNTRVASGFPPGAIANPGYEALYCAFYPAKTNYYYFVADSSGYNLYARTLAGHEQNKAEVRKEAGN